MAGKTGTARARWALTDVNTFRDPFNNGQGVDGKVERGMVGDYEIPASPTVASTPGNPSTSIAATVRSEAGCMSVCRSGRSGRQSRCEEAADHHDTDLFVKKSDDCGKTWSSGSCQRRGRSEPVLALLAVDQTTGAVGLAWYDTRRDIGDRFVGDRDGVPNTDSHVSRR